jgi:hypothetical protein
MAIYCQTNANGSGFKWQFIAKQMPTVPGLNGNLLPNKPGTVAPWQ